jgi:hypothetical protein
MANVYDTTDELIIIMGDVMDDSLHDDRRMCLSYIVFYLQLDFQSLSNQLNMIVYSLITR